jgi:predicted DCC family thiol-disulfide oxidoreductase YuxK
VNIGGNKAVEIIGSEKTLSCGQAAGAAAGDAHPIVLYDGVCGLCNRFVQFVLRRDRDAVFRFAALQSGLAARILSRHGVSPSALDTVYVVVDAELPGEHLLSRSAAVLFILQQVGGFWRGVAFLLRLLPKFLLDLGYRGVVRHRYRVFGRSEVCAVPGDQDRDRFLDL